MASELLVVNHVSEESVAGPVIVIGNEVAGLGNSEPAEVLRVAPVASDDLVFLRNVSVENLPGLAPELFAASEGQLSEPVLNRFGTVLGVKFTSVDQDRQLTAVKLFEVPGVVEKLVTSKSGSHSRASHFENWGLGAISNMNGFVDGLDLPADSEVIRGGVFDGVPVLGEDTLIVGEYLSTHILDVGHDI